MAADRPLCDQNLTHPFGCTSFVPFRGLTIGANHKNQQFSSHCDATPHFSIWFAEVGEMCSYGGRIQVRSR